MRFRVATLIFALAAIGMGGASTQSTAQPVARPGTPSIVDTACPDAGVYWAEVERVLTPLAESRSLTDWSYVTAVNKTSSEWRALNTAIWNAHLSWTEIAPPDWALDWHRATDEYLHVVADASLAAALRGVYVMRAYTRIIDTAQQSVNEELDAMSKKCPNFAEAIDSLLTDDSATPVATPGW